MKTIRVLFIISSLQGGGAARIMSELTSDLAERNFSVTLLTLEGADGLDTYPLHANVERRRIQLFWPSHGLTGKITSFFKRFRMLRQAIVAARPDVAVSFIDTTNIRVLASMVFSGIPVIVSERTDPRHHTIGKAWHRLRRLLYPLAARVVVQTEQVAKWMKHEIGSTHITVIPNALRPAAFLAAGDADGASGYKDRDPRRPRRIVSVGRLVSSKRFDRLIEGFAETGLADRGWELVIIGDGPERAALKNTISNLRLMNAVRLAGHQSDVASWLQQSDLFVMTSEYEGFPNALLEAMQCGVASIATNCESGPSDLITSGEDGLLIPVNDAAALVGAITHLASDPAGRAAMGRAAALACQKFRPEKIGDQWVDLILSATRSATRER